MAKKQVSKPTRMNPPRALNKRRHKKLKMQITEKSTRSESEPEDTETETQIEYDQGTSSDNEEKDQDDYQIWRNASDKKQKRKGNMSSKKRKVQKVAGKKIPEAKKKLKMIEEDQGKVTIKVIPSIKTRSSPKDLVKIINMLTDIQKENIIEMGFGSFLDDNFQINTTPTKLGFWVVQNFHPEKCTIRMSDGRAILITAKMIHEMIGIPMGTMAVKEVPAATTEYPLIVEWRQSYDHPDARFTIKTVVERLLYEHQDGRLFKLNFLVMFFSIIGECPKLGTVNQRFLECIQREEDIINMDWCTYLLGTMKKTAKEYKPLQGFGGPLVLMVLLYLNATISDKVVIEEQTPLMKSWDTKKLKLREIEELEMGGFGRLPIKEGYEYVEPLTKKKLTKSEIRSMKNSRAKALEYNHNDIIGHVYTPRVDLADGIFGNAEGSDKIEAIKQYQKKSAEEMVNDINKTLIFTEGVQEKLDEMLEMASISYPGHEAINKLVESRNEKLTKVFKPGKIADALELEDPMRTLIQLYTS